MGAFLSVEDLGLGCRAAASLAAAIVGLELFTPASPIRSTMRLFCQFRGQEKSLTSATNVDNSIDSYNELHKADTADVRKKQYQSLVNSYYDLVTIFYEVGWGQSFHFAYRHRFESFAESIRRHEYYLASKLQLTSNSSEKKVLDVGCGIGGPMRNIARFTGADVTGITLNPYQVQRGNELNAREPSLKCRLVQGDFMKMPFDDCSFDAAYAVEATCHAPDRVACYSEIRRVLKPGTIFACYEWCTTDLYNPHDPSHRKIKKQIEEGDALPDIISCSDCLDAFKQAGFEVLHERDLLDDVVLNGKDWSEPLQPSWNPFTQRFQFNWFGRFLTKYGLKLLELLFLAPKGTSKTQLMLQSAAIGLAQGGKKKIFTPMYLMVGRVPDAKQLVQ